VIEFVFAGVYTLLTFSIGFLFGIRVKDPKKLEKLATLKLPKLEKTPKDFETVSGFQTYGDEEDEKLPEMAKDPLKWLRR
jgi:hypothetical protein